MKWGILATGTIARKFAQTVNRMNAEGEALIAVGSRNPDTARAFAEQFGIPRCHASYEALAADPEVEAIYVATPNTLHFEHCKLCLAHGKHVLCEKPFTTEPGQAEALYRLAEEKGLFIMEALWTRLLPSYAKIRALIEGGAIGEVRSVTCQYGFVAQGARKDRKFNAALGGGALLDIGVYNLGFLHFVTGQNPREIVTDEVHINAYGTDDYSKLTLRYPGGVVAESIQTIGTELERNARIIGTSGSIFLPDFQCCEAIVVEGANPQTIPLPFDINGFEYEIREASRCVAAGMCHSDRYAPGDSVALMKQLYDIRTGWGVRFE